MARYSKRKVDTMVSLFLAHLIEDIMADVESVELFAWIGEDELGNGVIGIKQAVVPAGTIPIVATTLNKVNQEYLTQSLDAMGKKYGKKIFLCKFKFDSIISEVGNTGE